MRFYVVVGLLLALQLSGIPVARPASLEWDIQEDRSLDLEPLDLAVSENGAWVFFLAPGQVEVFDVNEGKVVAEIPVGKTFDRLAYSAAENALILSSKAPARMLRVELQKVYDFDLKGLPVLGKEDAPVTLAIFSDYQCPYCARLEPLAQQVLETYAGDVKIVHKNFPLSSHRFAVPAALAALAADRQGKFPEYHRALVAGYNKLSEDLLIQTAEDLGLDMERFQSDRKSPGLQALVRRDFEEGRKAEVKGIPTVFVNGKRIRTLNPEHLTSAIEKELKKRAP